MIVTFENVGRNNMSWKAHTETVSEAFLLSQIRKSKSLMSREIDVIVDGNSGTILVGGYRPVGTFRIEDSDGKTEAGKGQS